MYCQGAIINDVILSDSLIYIVGNHAIMYMYLKIYLKLDSYCNFLQKLFLLVKDFDSLS